MKENILKIKSIAFSIRVIRLYQYLCETKKEYVLSKQLLRSGTAIGLLSETDYISKTEYISMNTDIQELLKLLSVSLKTAKANSR